MDRVSDGLSLIKYFEQKFCTGKHCIDLPQNICIGVEYLTIVYDQNHYFGLGLILISKPKMADTFRPIL